jgi:NDP-sugar pyrophosphorylase family protein
VILAGGRGTRLQPYTSVFPKPLVPVDGVPIMEIIVHQLVRFDFNELTVCVNRGSYPLFQAYFGNGSAWGADIEYSIEDRPLGTVGALTVVRDLPDDFLVLNGDVLTAMNYMELYNKHLSGKGLLTVTVALHQTKLELGLIDFDSDGQMTKYNEKPVLTNAVSAGVYYFNKKALEQLEMGQYKDFPVLVRDLLMNKQRVMCYLTCDPWVDIGTQGDLLAAQEIFKQHRGLFMHEQD